MSNSAARVTENVVGELFDFHTAGYDVDEFLINEGKDSWDDYEQNQLNSIKYDAATGLRDGVVLTGAFYAVGKLFSGRSVATSNVRGEIEDSVTYYRVQGGTGNNSSQVRIIADDNGKILIPDYETSLYVSAYTREHAEYFAKIRGEGAEIIEIQVPKYYDDLIKETAIDQFGANSNPLNQGGLAPRIVDKTTPGTAYQLKGPFIEWLEEYGYVR